jgi:transposase-like protein
MSGRVPPPYAPEVRAEAVRLVREGGLSFKDAAKIAGCSSRAATAAASSPTTTTAVSLATDTSNHRACTSDSGAGCPRLSGL